MKFRFVICLVHVIFLNAYGQLTLEDIFLSSKYREKHPENLRFMKDDSFYTVQEGNSVLKKETLTGKVVDTLITKTDTLNRGKFNFFDYNLSPNENYLVLSGNKVSIYRRSFLADILIYNLKDKTFRRMLLPDKTSDKVGNVEISPDEKKVSFTYQNNLYVLDLSSNETEQVTHDGTKNFIINGSADWVYEEEFEFTKAYEWSNNSKMLAFLKFDESRVPDYNMQKWMGLYPENYVYKYPKAGEINAKVSLHVFNLERKVTNTILTDSLNCYYLPRFRWAGKSNRILFFSLNRQQTNLTIQQYNPDLDKKFNILFKQFPNSIELDKELFYSERLNTLFISGKVVNENGLYSIKCDNNAAFKKLINYNDLEIDYWDENKQSLFFNAPDQSPEERALFRLNLKSNKTEKLSINSGTHNISVSTRGNFYIVAKSASGQPSSFTLFDGKTNKKLRVLEDNRILKSNIENLHLPVQSFTSFKTSEGYNLNGWIIKPPTFDSTQKYPLIMFVYGGPGSQMVKNAWGGSYYLWHQFLASKGFIVACFDGRGTGGKQVAFRNITYGKLGELETKDQIEVARHLAKFSYIDSTQIGIWGWSFGGYLSTNSLLRGAEIFKAAIAVAPVTSWRFYDTIYSERYLGLPTDNAVGYDNNSPVMYADKLKGKYLLIHGTSDDNVHIQNTFAMQEALIRAGKEFETFIYPNKNHGISGGNTRYHLYSKMLEFWNRNLK